MPGIELSGDRRLLTLWLILSLLFGSAYYLGIFNRNPFVQRFERAYYAVFWSRPFLSTEKEGLEVGVIAPQYVSSLIDSEMWVWVRNTSTAAEPLVESYAPTDQAQVAAGREVVKNSAVLSPLVIVEYTPKITRQATTVPDSAEVSLTPTPQSTIQAQLLLREGESQTNYYTESRSTIMFTDIYPGETAARLVWVRLMPQAYRQGKGDPSESIYLSEQEITGTIQFDYTLWESPAQETGVLDFEGLPPEATINTRQAVMRGFARTLLLPPWSNGLLIGLGLISAFMINLLVNFVDLRLAESSEIEREERRNRSFSGIYEPLPTHKMSWPWQLVFWIGQIAFWACAISSVFLLVARMTEAFILCPMVEVATPSQPVSVMPVSGLDLPSGVHFPSSDTLTTSLGAQCVEWPLWPVFFITTGLAILLFYIGYLWKSIPVGTIGPAVRSVLGRNAHPTPLSAAQMSAVQLALIQIAASLGELVQSFNLFTIHSPGTQDSSTSAGDLAGPEVETDTSVNHPATPEDIARRDARKQADDLTMEIKDLHKDLMRGNIESLEAYKYHADDCRNRYIVIIEKEKAIPPEANWTHPRRVGPTLLKEIDKSLDQLVGYLSLAKPVKDLSDSIRNGDPTGLDRLMEIRTQLAGDSRPLTLEPARSLSEKTVTQIEETERYYQEHFVDLHTNIVDDSSLVGVLDKLIILRNKEGSVVYVRFFSDSEDVFNDRTERMYLSQAYDIAIGRLSGYRLRLLREKEDKFQTILGFDRTSEGDKQRTLSDLNSLLDEIRGWPDSLHGYKEYPESAEGEDSFPQRVDTLKRNISEAISVL